MCIKNKKGSILITLIIAMVMMAALGIGIYSMTTSSNFSELLSNRNDNAYQLAKAGIRYAVDKGATVAGDFWIPDNSKKFNLAINGNQITSTGIVNEGTFLEARRVLKYTISEPPFNNNVLLTSFEDLNALDLTNSGTIVRIGAYIATGGTHLKWASFQGSSGYYFTDPEAAGCTIGYHVVPISNSPIAYRDALRTARSIYNRLSYDTQVKVGWDLNVPYGVTGITFRWHESATTGKYEGYGLSFMRYHQNSGCSGDGIPNGIKPPGLAEKSLLVLWRQQVVGGIETKVWLAYAELGNPTTQQDPTTGERSPADPDQKVTGNQGWPDGIGVSDDSAINIRIEDTFVDGQQVNKIKLFYGDASPKFASRTRDQYATNIQRGRYSPDWILPTIFPRWPSNKFDPDPGTFATWRPGAHTFDWYDYFTLVSTVPQDNKVLLVVNSALVKTALPCNATDVMCLLDDKATIQTKEFILDTYASNREEIGLHAMGNLAGYSLAFDDFTIQTLGVSE